VVTSKFNRILGLNQNNLVWPVFEEYDRFTPPQRVETILSVSGQDLWARMVSKFNLVPGGGRERTPDDDILAGRIKKFTSMDDLIEDLDDVA
jgi:hypothetical protein